MLELILFLAVTVIAILAALDIFLEKELFKSAIALAVTFAASAAVLLFLSQTLIAILQLLLLVGGLSTYLIVAVASGERKYFRHTDMRVLVILFIVLDAVFTYVLSMASFSLVVNGNESIGLALDLGFIEFYVLLYFIVLLLFAVSIGSILLIKKMVQIVV